jgi:hypothetical protein
VFPVELFIFFVCFFQVMKAMHANIEVPFFVLGCFLLPCYKGGIECSFEKYELKTELHTNFLRKFGYLQLHTVAIWEDLALP